MSIQRWDVFISHDDNGEYAEHVRSHDGQYVTYADHVAAVRKAYREGYSDHARTVQHWQDTHGAYRVSGNVAAPSAAERTQNQHGAIKPCGCDDSLYCSVCEPDEWKANL